MRLPSLTNSPLWLRGLVFAPITAFGAAQYFESIELGYLGLGLMVVLYLVGGHKKKPTDRLTLREWLIVRRLKAHKRKSV